ncbi:hypothetical protein TNIN_230561 [Trichonephila inaurata madagascariensis]|uniref:Uncharacterized protein n=1 Tax=Trichonephila inaurata madagascariensis TaxID=2747483 RepID=A0A8X7CA35_9ARAC|nr:hypothetical protein TNIN_230561 [Trichonephila inaurata madagascariensis]
MPFLLPAAGVSYGPALFLHHRKRNILTLRSPPITSDPTRLTIRENVVYCVRGSTIAVLADEDIPSDVWVAELLG